MDEKEYREEHQKLYNALAYNRGQLEFYKEKVEYYLLMIKCNQTEIDELNKKHRDKQ